MKQEKDLYKLTSIDERGSHIDIIPAEVKGFFRKRRTILQYILILIFLGLPWLYIGGVQSIRLNIPAREFTFFSFIFKAHDAPLVFLLILIVTLGLAFVTSVWGRVWCGWACPQTVFIDAIYRRIEILIEGNYLERRKLKTDPRSFHKVYKKTLKWITFFFVSSLFAHSFVAYFTGSRELLTMMQRPPTDNWTYFLVITTMTCLVTFDFGWFREQFCVIMCPYGRIQSVLLDPSSLAVVYNQERGEPRRDRQATGEKVGDCISCNKCVEVCPTGIDIRNGLQMECISCTACIDACDEIMEKVKKPKGLIGYNTLDRTPISILKLKPIVYLLIIIIAFGVLVYNLQTRASVSIAVLRGIESPFSESKNVEGSLQITNHFRLHLTSQSNQDTQYQIELAKNNSELNLTVVPNPLIVKARTSETWHLFVSAPKIIVVKKPKFDFDLIIKSSDGNIINQTFTFIGPQK